MEKKAKKPGCGDPNCPVCGDNKAGRGFVDIFEKLFGTPRGKDSFSFSGSGFPGFSGAPGTFEKIATMLEGGGPEISIQEIIDALDGGDIRKIMELGGDNPFGSPHVRVISSEDDLDDIMQEMMGNKADNSEREAALKALPEDIQKDNAEFSAVLKNGKHIPLENGAMNTIEELNLVQGLKFDSSEKGNISVTVSLEGIYTKVVSEIGNDEIAALIPKVIGLEDEISALFESQQERRNLFADIQRTKKGLQRQLDGYFSRGWAELSLDKNVLSVQQNEAVAGKESSKEAVAKFLFVLNGEVQTEVRLDDDFGEILFSLQKALAQQKEGAAKEREAFDETSVKISSIKGNLFEALIFIRSYLKRNPIADCNPVGIGLDLEGSPCIIVEKKVDTELPEVPGIIKRRLLEGHLSGKNPLPKDYQKALGLDEKIAQIKKGKASIEEIKDSL
ncbi:hypothetical protein HN784_00280 [bacterium]|jgi:hypothetical protein|nr:hypothetical protein [bacterium]MBT4251419.1 hypothetical protein [bacterium]MBT4598155.1 hypothetical protein [bacterium]MBT6754370.1 hypothetical protein [bacterium]MBT7037288.1 hypothetical protein [bacterium]